MEATSGQEDWAAAIAEKSTNGEETRSVDAGTGMGTAAVGGGGRTGAKVAGDGGGLAGCGLVGRERASATTLAVPGVCRISAVNSAI